MVNPGGSDRPPLLLVAEDNEANQRVAVAMLSKLGCAAEVAVNGQEAVAAFRDSVYRAIFMDCQMPVMDGYSAARAIRTLEGDESRIPIIAMTASVTGDVRRRCEEAGMDDYLPKPVMLDQLRAVLQRWVKPPPGLQNTPPVAHPTTQTPFDPDRIAELRTLNRPGKPDAFLQFAEQFMVDAAARLASLRKALAREDLQEAAYEAHAMYGGAATIGAMTLADACRGVEARLVAGEPVDAEAVARLEQEIARAKSFLDRGETPPPAG